MCVKTGVSRDGNSPGFASGEGNMVLGMHTDKKAGSFYTYSLYCLIFVPRACISYTKA